MFPISIHVTRAVTKRIALGSVLLLCGAPSAWSQTTVSGAPFSLVATHPGATQLFGLTTDSQGRIYIGNNSDSIIGPPTQRLDPVLFSGTPLALANFGPAVGDADGIAFGNGFVYVADASKGVEKIDVSNGNATLFAPSVATNLTGSPLALRPTDGHLFVGRGGVTNDTHIDEYDASGSFVRTHLTGTDVETMTYDPTSGLIYYAPYGSSVRALNPITGADTFIGAVSGTIDGGLTFDPISGLLFVGTANGVNPGVVDTIAPTTGVINLFAFGFNGSGGSLNGSSGILRDPFSGDLYFLDANNLYRLPSSQVTPEPGSIAFLFSIGMAGAGFLARRRKKAIKLPSRFGIRK